MREFLIRANDADQRLDKFITKVTVGLPSSLLYKGLRKNGVKVNGKRADKAYRLQVGDQVRLWFPEEFFSPKEDGFKQLKHFPTVVFEDEDLLIVHKGEGLSCHSDEQQKTNTLIDQVKAYLYHKGEYDPEAESAFAPALCNRIDRNTEGLVVCAKTALALRDSNEAIRRHLFQKEYLALIEGRITPQKATLTHYLRKDSEKNTVSVFDRPTKGALTAILDYEVEEYSPQKEASRIRVRLHTGRTHQIRAQLAHVGHPLVGDGKYGITGGKSRLGFRFQALLAFRLTLFYPEGSPLARLNGTCVSLPMPERFRL